MEVTTCVTAMIVRLTNLAEGKFLSGPSCHGNSKKVDSTISTDANAVHRDRRDCGDCHQILYSLTIFLSGRQTFNAKKRIRGRRERHPNSGAALIRRPRASREENERAMYHCCIRLQRLTSAYSAYRHHGKLSRWGRLPKAKGKRKKTQAVIP